MFTKISRKIFISIALLISGACLFAHVDGIRAAQLPVRTFNSADGLIGESINRIVHDSRGFLWFCTTYGLSRFDGQEFKNYSGEQGLPSRNVNDFLESRDGIFLAATSNGLAIFDPKGKPFRWNVSTMSLDRTGPEMEMFRTLFPPDTEKDRAARVIQAIGEDLEGRIFLGTAKGLYRLEESNGEWQMRRIESPLFNPEESVIEFATDRFGYVWMVTSRGVFRLDPSNESITKIHEKGGDSLLADREGQMWVTSGGEMLVGLRVFSFDEHDQPFLAKTYTDKDGLRLGVFMRDIVQAANGRIYVVDGTELYELDPSDGSSRFRPIVEGYPTCVAEDPGGNLWVGTDDRGVIKIFLTGLKIYDESDGAGPDNISSIFLNRSNELTLTLGKQKLARFVDGKFEVVRPLGLTTRSWGGGQLDFQSVDGEWWIPAYDGLRRYPTVKRFSDLERTPATHVFTIADGLFTNEVFNAFGDSHGDVWLSVIYGDDALVRWEKSSGKIYRYTTADGFPKSNGPVAYAEDLDGDIWFALYSGGVARFRRGKFEFYGAEHGIPSGSLSSLFRDSHGRIWISSLSRGIFRIDDPTADVPSFTNISTNDGLSTNETVCVTEDKLGAIYIGTGLGLNRLDPKNGTVKLFSRADGLPGNPVSLCQADDTGKLWFVIARKLVSLDPQVSSSSPNSLDVFIGGVRAGKVAQPVSDLGEVDVAGLNFAADQRDVQIDYFAFNYGNADRLRYQYRLNDQDWSAPSDRRTVDLNLAPGNYEFSVRAINSDGVASEHPATVAFALAPPFWQTWVFRAAVVIGIILILVWLDRLRARRRRERRVAADALARANSERLRELEQVRRRIATDLHDDIGSSLTQISILSEVLRQRIDAKQVAVAEPLSMIADSSRELVDSMSDIVWAINPQKDYLRDLTQRMRRFASDVFTTREIEFTFDAPTNEVEIGANIRRELFLIFKEAIHNVVKHANCSFVEIVLAARGNELELTVRDNGRGFALGDRAGDGHGLLSIRERAAGIGGSAEIATGESGTVVRAIVPIASKSTNGHP